MLDYCFQMGNYLLMNFDEYFLHTGDTPERLALRAGVHVSTIYRIKSGVRNAGPRLIPRIYQATSGLVTANDFFDLTQTPIEGQDSSITQQNHVKIGE